MNKSLKYSASGIMTKKDFIKKNFITSVCTIFLVYSGHICIDADAKKYYLNQNKGIFLPAIKKYHISSSHENIKIYYISFEGDYVDEILLDLEKENEIFDFEIPVKENLKNYILKLNSITEFELSSKLKKDGILREFLADFLLLNNKNKTISKNSRELMYCEKIKNYVLVNFSKNIKVSEIADHLKLNRSHLNHIFKKRYGISIKRYITEFKMEKAQTLLKNENLSIKEISSALGYSNQLYFSKVVKKNLGISPIQFRKSI